MGYKQKNKGLLTIPLLGEVFANLFLKIKDKTSEMDRKVFLQNAVDFFDGTILWFLQKEKLSIAKLELLDFQYAPKIKELDYAVTDDDALHLSVAINKKCQRFITIDKVLLNENFRGRIRSEFGLVISSPN